LRRRQSVEVFGGSTIRIDDAAAGARPTRSTTIAGVTIQPVSGTLAQRSTVDATALPNGEAWLHVRAHDTSGWSVVTHRRVRTDKALPGAVTLTSTSHPSPTTWYRRTPSPARGAAGPIPAAAASLATASSSTRRHPQP